MDKVTFIRKAQDAIESRVSIDRHRTERVIGAVFSALSSRLTPGEGKELIAQLPLELKRLWYEEVAKRQARGEEEVTKLSKDQFLMKVQNNGRLASITEAEFVARCVIRTLKEAISPGEIQDAVAQLPSDLKAWFSAA